MQDEVDNIYAMQRHWTVETLDRRVDREIRALSLDLKARMIGLMDALELGGPQALGMPFTRHLADGLWELRVKGKDGIARAIYIVVQERRIVIVHAFTKKSQKTPLRALDTARRRAREARR